MTNAFGTILTGAHRWLIAGFGLPLADTLVAELDSSGHFDLICDLGDGAGQRHTPLIAGQRACPPRSREAFIWWGGNVAQAMLHTVDAVRESV